MHEKEVRGIWKTDEMIKMSQETLLSNHKSQPKDPKRTEDSVPDEESEDFRAKDQPSGVIDAQ